MLDLGGQAERPGPLPPLVEIRVSPVGDHHERQDVRQVGDLLHVVGGGLAWQHELEQADRLPSLRHRRQHPPLGGIGVLGVLPGREDLDGLGPHRLLLRAAVERDRGRRLLCVVAHRRIGREVGIGVLAAPRGTCASRTRARPERSATRNDTVEAWSALPSSRVTASTASTGETASVASRTLPRGPRSALRSTRRE